MTPYINYVGTIGLNMPRCLAPFFLDLVDLLRFIFDASRLALDVEPRYCAIDKPWPLRPPKRWRRLQH
jgi:hypothetical protein